jgi:anti-sigma28 factor (negative regulator of flagellin synthesis)
MEIRSQAPSFQELDPVVSAPSAKTPDAASTTGGQALGPDVASLGSGQMLSGDDVRTGTVQALQSQIASGTYQVSAQDVASKLVDSMLQQG